MHIKDRVLDETYMVTFVGSPPNAEMYFCTQRRASLSVEFEGQMVRPRYRHWIALTVLQTEIADTSILYFLAREEAES